MFFDICDCARLISSNSILSKDIRYQVVESKLLDIIAKQRCKSNSKNCQKNYSKQKHLRN